MGDTPELGSWELGAAPLMSWSEGDVWHCTVELPVGAGVEYKFLQLIPNKRVSRTCLFHLHPIKLACIALHARRCSNTQAHYVQPTLWRPFTGLSGRPVRLAGHQCGSHA